MTRRKSGPIALKAVRQAEENLGVRERGGNNRGKWVEFYQKVAGIVLGSDPWCMAYVFTRLWKAAGSPRDYKLPRAFPRTGSTIVASNWAKRSGRWIPIATARKDHSVVMRGDLLFFYIKRLRRIGHVGIVAGVRTDGVISIEGNTSVSGSREGDAVIRRVRTWDEINGFAVIDF